MENSTLIDKALQYINSQSAESGMTIEDVAAHAGFSTDYFNRIFQSHTGFSVMEYARFTRLKKASRLLRTTDREILDIALECGYEAHESFTRAFRKQYGKNPSEYRAYYANRPMSYADVTDDVVGNRFCHEFPEFSPVDSDTVCDELLTKDARKFGYTVAAMYVYNGTRFFTDGNILVGLDEFGKGNYCADVITDDTAALAQCYRKISGFVENFGFASELEAKEIDMIFRENGVDNAEIRLDAEYCVGGECVKIESARDSLTISPLTADDIPKIRAWAVDYGHDWKLEETLTQRDIYHNAPWDLPYGIFIGDKLIGVCRVSVYEFRGMKFGEIEGVAMLEEYSCRENEDYIFSEVLEYVRERECLPICLTPRDTNENDALHPERFGFEPVCRVYGVYKK